MSDQSNNSLPDFLAALTPETFLDWHLKNQRERNVAEGYQNRNDPAYTQPADEHSPHNALGCHRRIEYKTNNTPSETSKPHGVFKIGHDFEAYVENYLAATLAETDYEVQNTIHLTDTLPQDIGSGEQLHSQPTITGSTDPVVVDSATQTPAHLFEVKSTSSLYHIKENGPQERHRGQAHLYAHGLMHKYGLSEPPAITYVYLDKETLEVAFPTEAFDLDFWEDTLLPWLATNQQQVSADELAEPVDPDGDKAYMCGFCEYAERCGNYEPETAPPWQQDDATHTDEYWYNSTAGWYTGATEDMGVKGFVPVTQYPEHTVIEHLATHTDVLLTPTVAAQYPTLDINSDTANIKRFNTRYGYVTQRAVLPWVCTECGTTYEYTPDIEYDGRDFTELPRCDCTDRHPRVRGMTYDTYDPTDR